MKTSYTCWEVSIQNGALWEGVQQTTMRVEIMQIKNITTTSNTCHF